MATLQDMGFGPNRATRALKATGYKVIHWLKTSKRPQDAGLDRLTIHQLILQDMGFRSTEPPENSRILDRIPYKVRCITNPSVNTSGHGF